MSASDESRGARAPRILPPVESNSQEQNNASSTPPRRQVLKLGASLLTVGGSGALLAACGGGGGGAPVLGPLPAPAPAPAPASAPPPPAAAAKISSFALAVMPDTQFYARYATAAESDQYDKRFGSAPFAAQTKWIAANAKALNIPFTVHLGDVVDQVGKPDQWKVADAAMKVLEDAKLPYSVLAGNHDVLRDIDYSIDPVSGTDANRTPANEPYIQWFGAERAKKQATFGARDPSGFHEYHVFEAQGQKFMVLSLSWRISDAGIAWARQMIAKNPTLPVILVNHQLLNIAPDGTSPLETDYGKMLWEKLIRDNDQIFMTLNGHHHGAAHLTKINNFGRKVEEMVVDYQMAYQGGNGLMRLYEFDLTNKKIKVLSFSPWVPQKPAATLNAFDQAVLTTPNEAFEIDMDFAQRFGGFNKSFGTGSATVDGSLVDKARAMILANYKEPATVAQRPAANSEDYPKVANTLAHWRFFGGTVNQPVLPGTVVPDVTGNNPLHRDALNQGGVVGAADGDIVWTEDRHYLSAAPGSVRFLNTNKNTPRLSYFLTDAAAPINAQTLDNGYTIEAFIKIDKSWTSNNQAWMNIMTRDGRRGDLPGFTAGDGESPPMLFAISSLREVQWEVVPSPSAPPDPKTNWSGEVIADRWVHIAIVNDPVSHDTTMYVEGAPVLRNATAARGLATLSATSAWVVGGGSWDGARADGFFGNIGEVRVVASALASSQWLTARKPG
ncbi:MULTISPECIES: LamG-like jellyroll fold domain-containing protein [unclassified Variovorax]|uniref:LamG-like jellyroll fold domain-containing protein n=1 Tax=unclassified Variovorax TaxID=663243 RepID=UPI000D137183|nr:MULTISPECIES: metallophosphoesterase [unclassified Variovorax]AVQ79721.1 modulator protein [Variovorax sp. PMC12]QRY30949.1 metallophosphoesterase [Variovorax sp. PDNC026]